MRSPSALALVLGLTGVGAACGGEGSGPSNVPPTAAFLPSCASLDCTFADSSIDADGEVTTYSWNFGDGAPPGTTRDAHHTYAAASSYAVTLTVTDNDGAVSAVTETVEATAPSNAPPTAGFTASCAELACSFVDASTDGDGSVVGYHWDFGDGSEAATPTADHRYAAAGTYTVALTVTDDGGATGTLVQQLTVADPADGPTADFAGSCRATGSFGRDVFYECLFTDQSTAAAGATLTAWAWDFGDGTSSTEQNPVHHYTRSYRPGVTVSFSATLTVTDDSGRTNEVRKAITVSAPANIPPAARFTSVCAGLSCSFTDLSSDDDGTVVGFHWNFGDGSVVESQNSTHSYASAGTYVVELTVTDDSGATGILSQSVTVTGTQTAAAPTISIGVPYGLVRYGLCYPALVGPGVRGCRSSASLSISNTGGGTLNWTATKDASWLRISPKSGAAPSTMAVWVNATGVLPGSYYGHIKVSAPGATNSPQTVTVHFTRY